jgi:dTDP-4-dehydrorhamnose 3,5-epimerase
MSRFQIAQTPLAGVMRVRRHRVEDDRGWLSRLFCQEELAGAGWAPSIQQINLTSTRALGTIRGMHYQLPPHAECKLVSCLRGEVWDVAVDVRHGSPTFLQWHAVCLSEANDTALLLPEGVAHGFQSLTKDAELLYLHSRQYVPHAERGLDPLDPRLAIRWPLPVSVVSPRDRSHPPLADAFAGVVV